MSVSARYKLINNHYVTTNTYCFYSKHIYAQHILDKHIIKHGRFHCLGLRVIFTNSSFVTFFLLTKSKYSFSRSLYVTLQIKQICHTLENCVLFRALLFVNTIDVLRDIQLHRLQLHPFSCE